VQRSRGGSDLQTANGTSPETGPMTFGSRLPPNYAPCMKHGIYFVSLLTVDGVSTDDVAFVGRFHTRETLAAVQACLRKRPSSYSTPPKTTILSRIEHSLLPRERLGTARASESGTRPHRPTTSPWVCFDLCLRPFSTSRLLSDSSRCLAIRWSGSLVSKVTRTLRVCMSLTSWS
jgi:hypothetical protein